MSLRQQIQSQFGGQVATRKQVVAAFPRAASSYLGVILSNSEIGRNHSPGYSSFTRRVGRGRYRIYKH